MRICVCCFKQARLVERFGMNRDPTVCHGLEEHLRFCLVGVDFKRNQLKAVDV